MVLFLMQKRRRLNLRRSAGWKVPNAPRQTRESGCRGRQDRLKSLFDDSEISGVHESRPEGNNIDMKLRHTVAILLAWLFILKGGASSTETETPATDPPRAFINGQGPGWVTLGEKDFADVNGWSIKNLTGQLILWYTQK